MKLLLSAVFAAALVLTPTPVDAKTSRTAASSCTGWKTVEIRHGRKVVKAHIACPQGVRAKPSHRFDSVNVWG